MIVSAINSLKSNNYNAFPQKRQSDCYSFYLADKQNKLSTIQYDRYNKAISNISFAALKINNKSSKLLINILPPITKEEEYMQILKEVCNTPTIYGERFWNMEFEYNNYKNIKEAYIGLLPYCGNCDVSYYINCYLSKRPANAGTYVASEKSMCNIIRALDYSLARLDEDFGKYEGIVFRKGFFSPKPIQYASTSMHAGIASSFNGFNMHDEFSIIRVKNAHKIYDFQKAMNSSYATEESEILIDRHSRHRLVPLNEYDDEIIKAKEELARFMYLDFHSGINSFKIKTNTLQKKFMNIIKVYEEI